MNYLIINGILIVLLAYFFITKILPPKGVKQITTQDLKQLLSNKSKYQFIDVRTPLEYQQRRIKEFKNIPLNELEARLSELNKEKEIVVICQSGMRSNQATKLLVKHGFKNVTNVKGGMGAWNG